MLPRTTDAYYRRVRRAWRDWHLAARAGWADYDAVQRTMLAQLEALAPPQQLEEFHARLVASAAEPYGSASRLPPGDARAAAMTKALALTAQLRDLPTSGHDVVYLKVLQQLRVADHSAYARAASHFEAETRRFATRLARLHLPPGMTAEHEQLVDALREYADAAQQLALAWTIDHHAVQAAGARLDSAEHRVDRAHERIGERTGWRIRWPVEGEPP